MALEEVGKPNVRARQFLLALLSKSEGRMKLRQELAGSRAEMNRKRMSAEIWSLLF